MDAVPEATLVVRNTFLEFVPASPHRDGERGRRHSDSAIVVSPSGASGGCLSPVKDRSRLCSDSTTVSTGSESLIEGIQVVDGSESLTPSSPSVQDQEMCDRQMQAMNSHAETVSAPLWMRCEQPWADATGCEQPWADATGTWGFNSSMPSYSYAARTQEAPWHRQQFSDGSQAVERTTVMLRNLPNGYTREMLLDLVDEEGFANQYDFVYLPIDFGRGLCLGYVFINLISASAADRFVQHFTGFSKWMLSSNKVCCVSWSSPHQGLAQHVDRYRNSPVMHSTIPDGWKPVLFAFPSGAATRIAFPPPTKQIRPPNIRRRPEAAGGHEAQR